MDCGQPGHPGAVSAVHALSEKILRITAQSVLDGDTGAFSLRYFRQFFSDPYYFTTLLNSFKVALCATVTCLVLGVPLAYIYNVYELKGRKILQPLIVLCSMSAPFIGAYSWVLLLGRSGVITKFIKGVFGVKLPGIYGFGGILLSLMMGGAMIPYKSWMLGLANTWKEVTGGNINLGFMFLVTGHLRHHHHHGLLSFWVPSSSSGFSAMQAFDVEKLGEESKHLRPRAKRIIVVYLITMLLAIFAGTFLTNPLSKFLNGTLTLGGLYCLCSAI